MQQLQSHSIVLLSRGQLSIRRVGDQWGMWVLGRAQRSSALHNVRSRPQNSGCIPSNVFWTSALPPRPILAQIGIGLRKRRLEKQSQPVLLLDGEPTEAMNYNPT